MKRKDLPFRPEFLPMIADGRKTQTRRCSGLAAVNKNPDEWEYQGINTLGEHLFYNKDPEASNPAVVCACPWSVGFTYPPAGFKIGSIRAERVVSISDDDIKAEGFDGRWQLAEKWDAIHRRDVNNRWHRNPWCWRIEKAAE